MEADICTLNMKMENIKTWMKKNLLMIMVMITFLPSVLAYTTPLQIPTIWDVVVEGIFGSFWIAVFFIALIYFIILALGGVAINTNLIFNAIFLLCMSLGYYNPLIAAMIMIGFVLYGVYAGVKYVSGV